MQIFQLSDIAGLVFPNSRIAAKKVTILEQVGMRPLPSYFGDTLRVLLVSKEELGKIKASPKLFNDLNSSC